MTRSLKLNIFKTYELVKFRVMLKEITGYSDTRSFVFPITWAWLFFPAISC